MSLLNYMLSFGLFAVLQWSITHMYTLFVKRLSFFIQFKIIKTWTALAL